MPRDTADRMVEWEGYRSLVARAVDIFRHTPMEELGAAGVIAWTLSLAATISRRCGPMTCDALEELNREIHERCFAAGVVIAPGLSIRDFGPEVADPESDD